MQALATSPTSAAAQTGAISAAQQFAQSLNGMSSGIQGLRTQAEPGPFPPVEEALAAEKDARTKAFMQAMRRRGVTGSVASVKAGILETAERYEVEEIMLVTICNPSP